MFTKLIFLALLAYQVFSADVEFELVNNSGNQPVFVQTLANVETTAFVLAPKDSITLSFPQPWSGRIWGRTDCFSDADCAAAGRIPTSLVEITVGNGQSYYDLSLVDGFNINLSVEPIGGHPDGSRNRCKKAACAADILASCPNELKLKNKAGQVVSCQSACIAFHSDFYCCRTFEYFDNCAQSDKWPVDYIGFFKNNCPDVSSYTYDDYKTRFTCDTTKYTITFL